MDKESTNKLVPLSLKRTLLAFIVGGFIFNYVVNMIFFVCQIIWIDFIHYNPYRSQSHALFLLAYSPIYALGSFIFSVSSVIFATIIAMVSHFIWGRVPLYSLVIMVPLCSYIQPLFIPSLHDFLHIPSLQEFQDILWYSIRQLPVLIGCWWWSSHTSKS